MFKGERYAICKFELWVGVLDQFSVLEKPNVAQAEDFCLCALYLVDFEVLAGSECKEDAKPC